MSIRDTPMKNYFDILDRLRAVEGRASGMACEALGILRHHSPAYEIVRITAGKGRRKICLAAGIHGDEPAGVEALVRFLEGFEASGWERQDGNGGFAFVVFPCNNPSGFERGTRENADGIDLNREFGKKDPPPEVNLIQQALGCEPFEFFVDFHEDTDGKGFYLYEIFREGHAGRPMGREVVETLSRRWPIDGRKRIEGHPNRDGIIRPEKMPELSAEGGWGLPLPVFLYYSGLGHCMTLETPTFLPFEDRVRMHLTGLDTLLSRL